MSNADYYPPGAYYDSDAPYNQIDPPEVEFDVRCTTSLSKRDKVVTDKVYLNDDDWELCDDVTADELWEENYYDIPTLLDELVKYIDLELKNKLPYSRKRELQDMKASAQGWDLVIEECDFE